MKNTFIIYAAAALFSGSACNNTSDNMDKSSATRPATPAIKEEQVTYMADSVTCKGFVAYDSAVTGKRPVVLIVHEWWGLTDYAKSRARQLAAMGYLAFAVDMYGEGRTAADPAEAEKLSTPFYTNAAMAKSRFDAALAMTRTYAQADTTKIAAIGYCFGGGIVLNMARMGEQLNGVVSFHGDLAGVPADKKLLTAKILVCHGDDDQFVKPAEVVAFKKQMDSIGADYTFRSYPGATHAFSNPEATALGKKFNLPIAYNADADAGSWKAMQDFFARIFK
jgi:dienelactone hydrolase